MINLPTLPPPQPDLVVNLGEHCVDLAIRTTAKGSSQILVLGTKMICSHTTAYACVQIHTHSHMHTRTHTHTHTHKHTHVHTRTCTHTHMYTHTHTHTRTHQESEHCFASRKVQYFDLQESLTSTPAACTYMVWQLHQQVGHCIPYYVGCKPHALSLQMKNVLVFSTLLQHIPTNYWCLETHS